MREYLKFYIDGQWVDPVEPKTLDVDNPTTEQVSGKIAIGTAADVDKAVKAARKAFADVVADAPARSAWTCCRRSPPSTRSASADLADAVTRGDGCAAVAGGRPPGDARHRSPDGAPSTC